MVAISNTEREVIRQKVAKPMLGLALVSITMLFAGLTSAYVVSRGKDEAHWFQFNMPQLFWISSAIILLSSLTLIGALAAAKKDNQKGIKSGLILTAILGLGFIVTQFLAWNNLIAQGVFFAATKDASGSYLYMLTGLHLLHLLAGMIYLGVIIFKAQKGVFNSSNLLGLQLCSIYWHFLDALWIYLFLFLFFIH